MNKLVVAICVMLLASMPVHATEVYKWKDSEGRLRYSDMPPTGKTPYEILSGKKAASARAQMSDENVPTPVAKPARSVADNELDARKRKAEADSTQKKSQEKQDEQKIREQNCATAKSNMMNYKQGGRMYKMDEKGERHYLDDKEIALGLEKTSQEVDKWCGAQ